MGVAAAASHRLDFTVAVGAHTALCPSGFRVAAAGGAAAAAEGGVRTAVGEAAGTVATAACSLLQTAAPWMGA